MCERNSLSSPDFIGRDFVGHYVSHGHVSLRPRSLISPAFPTSFLMSAGFHEIDAVLRGHEKIPSKSVVLQPCFRHFDASRRNRRAHLSLFFMGAALYAPGWVYDEVMDSVFSYLLDVAGLPEKRLWLSTFAGGKLGEHLLPPHEKALECWFARGRERSRIVRYGVSNNFWHEGDKRIPDAIRFGGPQAEIFFDCTERSCECGEKCLPGCTCGRFIELANIISISYRFLPPNEVQNINSPLCESVVGIERTLMAMERCVHMADLSYHRQLLESVCGNGKEVVKAQREVLFQVFERLRAFCVIVGQGCVPAGKGRGSVLRRLFRLAVQDAAKLSDKPEEFVRDIVERLIGYAGNSFGVNLRSCRGAILDVIGREVGLLAKEGLD